MKRGDVGERVLTHSEGRNGAVLEQATVRPQSSRQRVPEAIVTPRLLTAKQAGLYLGFQTAWPVRELAWKGELPVVRIGKRRIAFDKYDLDSFIEQRKYRQSD